MSPNSGKNISSVCSGELKIKPKRSRSTSEGFLSLLKFDSSKKSTLIIVIRTLVLICTMIERCNDCLELEDTPDLTKINNKIN